MQDTTVKLAELGLHGGEALINVSVNAAGWLDVSIPTVPPPHAFPLTLGLFLTAALTTSLGTRYLEKVGGTGATWNDPSLSCTAAAVSWNCIDVNSSARGGAAAYATLSLPQPEWRGEYIVLIVEGRSCRAHAASPVFEAGPIAAPNEPQLEPIDEHLACHTRNDTVPSQAEECVSCVEMDFFQCPRMGMHVRGRAADAHRGDALVMLPISVLHSKFLREIAKYPPGEAAAAMVLNSTSTNVSLALTMPVRRAAYVAVLIGIRGHATVLAVSRVFVTGSLSFDNLTYTISTNQSSIRDVWYNVGRSWFELQGRGKSLPITKTAWWGLNVSLHQEVGRPASCLPFEMSAATMQMEWLNDLLPYFHFRGHNLDLVAGFGPNANGFSAPTSADIFEMIDFGTLGDAVYNKIITAEQLSYVSYTLFNQNRKTHVFRSHLEVATLPVALPGGTGIASVFGIYSDRCGWGITLSPFYHVECDVKMCTATPEPWEPWDDDDAGEQNSPLCGSLEERSDDDAGGQASPPSTSPTPTSPTSSPSLEEPSNLLYLFALLVLLVVAVLGVVAWRHRQRWLKVCPLLLARRRKAGSRVSGTHLPDCSPRDTPVPVELPQSDPQSDAPRPDPAGTQSPIMPLVSEVQQISPHEVTLSCLLGEGGFGQVWYGCWSAMPVAVKLLHDKFMERERETLCREAQLLASLRHPCICVLYGTTTLQGRLSLVMEYMAGGSLASLLSRQQRGGGSDYEGGGVNGDHPLGWPLICRMASEVTAGLAFLHKNGIIHRDVKAANVLLDAANHAKVADFGVSKFCKLGFAPPTDSSKEGGSGSDSGSSVNDLLSSEDALESLHTAGVGTTRYAAPEVFRCLLLAEQNGKDGAGTPLEQLESSLYSVYSGSCDTFSFGLMLWEMTHRQIAFKGERGLAVVHIVASGLRPEIALPPEQAELATLICECWHQEPSLRISMQACAERLALLARVELFAGEDQTHAALSGSDLTFGPLLDGSTHFTAKMNQAYFVPSESLRAEGVRPPPADSQ